MADTEAIGMGLLARTIKVQPFPAEANLTDLATAINEWLEARGEETFVDIRWNHTDFSALIIYVEE